MQNAKIMVSQLHPRTLVHFFKSIRKGKDYSKDEVVSRIENLGEKPNLVVYREADVRKALEYGAVEMLILSSKLDKSLIKELKGIGEGISSTVEVVSTETTEGEQFQKLSGLGAILRFDITGR